MQAEKTAVIVVDMQKGFCKPSGSLYSERSESVIEPIQDFVSKARRAGCTIVYTRDVHEEEFRTRYYDEFERWGEHCVRGTDDTEIVAELEPREEEKVVEKGTYSGFYSTNMEQYLQFSGVENVIVVGVLTNVCVLHTAAEAALRDYRTIVLEDCTEALEDSHKRYALNHVDWLFGEVKSSEEIEFE